MNKSKKILALGLAGVMAMGMVGCANNETTPPVETPDVETTAPVETPDVENQTPEVETGDAVVVTMDQIGTTLRNTFGELYLPSMPLDQDTFNMMTGLTSDMYSEFMAEVPMMMTHVDKLFVVKTDNTEAVEAALNNYKTMQVEDAMQYPMNLTKLENAVVETHGEYVFYYMLGGYTESFVEDEVEQKEIETAYYEEQNAKAHDALVALFTDGTIAEPTVIAPMDEAVDGEVPAEGGDVVIEYDVTDLDVSGPAAVGDGTDMDDMMVAPEGTDDGVIATAEIPVTIQVVNSSDESAAESTNS